MRALEELPDRDKDRLLPSFLLRPWGASHHLASSVDRLIEAYGDRPAIIDLAEFAPPLAERPVHSQLAELRDQTDGFANWCAYVEGHPQFIPTLQVGTNPSEIELQARRLVAFGRGLVVRFPQRAFEATKLYAQQLSNLTDGGKSVIFILDYERADKELLLKQATAAGIVRGMTEVIPYAQVALSASSFPESFDGPKTQYIYERQFFDDVRTRVATKQLIYSDRGSARVEKQQGGGGRVYPRIDFPQLTQWDFFREPDEPDRRAVYRRLAREVIVSEIWRSAPRVWGTQMIERTALGDTDAIFAPARATAARINIHLHQQLFFDDPAAGYDTDEEWSD